MIRCIVDALKIEAGDVLVEIGPGRGALTEELVRSGANITAIELDRDLIPLLKEKFAHNHNFELRQDDALQMDFLELSRKAQKKLKLTANLPYYISTAILQVLIAQRSAFSEMVLMFQREVVQRITASAGDSERGFLTVMVEASMRTEKLFDVPPGAFRPTPKVWSSVVRLVPNNDPDKNEVEFRALVSSAFLHKRKTILNNLKPLYPNIAEGLEKAEIDSRRRAETLTIEEWRGLARTLDLS